MPRQAFKANPVLLVLVAIASVQTGSSFAKLLFSEATPWTVAWLRSTFAAAVLLFLAPARFRGRNRADWFVVVVYGFCLAGMNLLFYLSIQRIPIGLAVTLEFLGPLVLALRKANRARDVLWVVLAGAGVALLGVVPGELDWAGMAMALGAGVFWAAYILIAGPVGRRWSGASGLTVACIVGAVLLAGPGLAFSGPELLSPYVLGLALVVALLASVVPYGLELSARRSLSSGTFGILMSLEPAAAALLAWLIVGEMLGWQEWLALVCVVAASVGATTDRRRAMKPE